LQLARQQYALSKQESIIAHLRAQQARHTLLLSLLYHYNQRLLAFYQRFGFETEGTHCAYALRDGVYADVLSMARLHPQPPTIRPEP
jgi:RimJ/RimL family protein N-acetyltransferase